MTKAFEAKVIREGFVDTIKYRYVYNATNEGAVIIRITRDRLGTALAYNKNAWEVVKEWK